MSRSLIYLIACLPALIDELLYVQLLVGGCGLLWYYVTPRHPSNDLQPDFFAL